MLYNWFVGTRCLVKFNCKTQDFQGIQRQSIILKCNRSESQNRQRTLKSKTRTLIGCYVLEGKLVNKQAKSSERFETEKVQHSHIQNRVYEILQGDPIKQTSIHITVPASKYIVHVCKHLHVTTVMAMLA